MNIDIHYAKMLIFTIYKYHNQKCTPSQTPTKKNHQETFKNIQLATIMKPYIPYQYLMTCPIAGSKLCIANWCVVQGEDDFILPVYCSGEGGLFIAICCSRGKGFNIASMFRGRGLFIAIVFFRVKMNLYCQYVVQGRRIIYCHCVVQGENDFILPIYFSEGGVLFIASLLFKGKRILYYQYVVHGKEDNLLPVCCSRKDYYLLPICSGERRLFIASMLFRGEGLFIASMFRGKRIIHCRYAVQREEDFILPLCCSVGSGLFITICCSG